MKTPLKKSTHRRRSESGFTLVEMIVVSMLLLVAMLGLLAVFDASARINKNETDVADAQGAVRYGLYQMTRVIRMAGTGGLYVTQAVLNHNDRALPGINPTGNFSYDNVPNGVSVTTTNGTSIAVRPGTDMIEIRGVILSPLIGFDLQSGCGDCTGSQSLNVLPIVGDPIIGQHVNDDATQRPQFAGVDAYTINAGNPNGAMYVIVEDGNTDLHSGCSDPNPAGVTRYPQPVYNVGKLSQGTTLAGSNTFGPVDFGDSLVPRFNTELPSDPGGQNATPIQKVRRAGVMDDIIFFIGLDPVATDPTGAHPFLAQGIRRDRVFEVTRLAEDVEDLQVAYGIDADGNNAVSRQTGGGCAQTVDDPDANYSNIVNCDEWRPNVTGEAIPLDTDFQSQNPFVPGHPGAPPPNHCPLLHGVMVSLLAKAKDPDPTYHGPAAQGYQIMNSTAAPIAPGNHRRRVQTLKINLRNYAFQG
jgi:prepilin-type N-terminal cleavage/methylation domain-containing protein